MARKKLTDEEKASRDAQPKSKSPTIEEKVGAAQAQADAGDDGMQALMPAIDVYAEKLRQAKLDIKSASKKLRELLSA